MGVDRNEMEGNETGLQMAKTTEYETLGLILGKGKKQRLGRESRYEMWIRSRLYSVSCLIFWNFFLFYKQDIKIQSV